MEKEIDVFFVDGSDLKDTVYNEPIRFVVKIRSLQEYIFKNGKLHKSILDIDNVTFNGGVTIQFYDSIEEIILISFRNCYINYLIDISSKSTNLDLHLSNCLVKTFRSQTGNLNLIKVNNCFGNYNIKGATKADISYTEDNIFMNDWLSNYKIKNKLSQLLSIRTVFNLEDVENINIYGRQVEENRKNQITKNKKLGIYRENTGRFNEKDPLGGKR
jgi:hypothetical protein